MDLYREILTEALARQKAEISFPQLHLRPEEVVEQTCYRVLNEICRIIRDDTLSDPECFAKIEAIVSVLEDAGIHTGGRHDWG